MWRPASAAVLIAVVIFAAASTLTSRADTPTPTPESSAGESPSPSPEPSPSPSPEPTPEPLPPPPPPGSNPPPPSGPTIDPAYPGSLRPGDWVEITGTDSCLNMRYDPRLPTPLPDGTVVDNVMNCVPDGFVGRLDGFGYSASQSVPVEGDGHWWWHIVGQGWAAEEFLRLHHQGGIPYPERPDLAGAGLIAYLAADNSIWLMNADGSEQRPIVGRASETEYFFNLAWSPAGDRLSFTVSVGTPEAITRIVDLNGNLVVELAGLSYARWSPDGTRFAALRHHSSAGLGENWTPVIFDLNSGTETAVGNPSYMDAAPAWSPDGNYVAFGCTSTTGYSTAPDGSPVEMRLDCGGDGLRIVSAAGGDPRIILPFEANAGVYYRSPSWSPSGETIALLTMQEGGGCRGYTFLDVASGAISGCAPHPPVPTFIGGRCGGGPDMGSSTWTRDGRLIFAAQGAGQSGLFVHNPASGARTVIPNMGGGPASLAPVGDNLTFAAGPGIWVAGLDGTNLTLLAEGHSPAWQPLP